MRKAIDIIMSLFGAYLIAATTWAGPYPPAADETGSDAIHRDDPAFVHWATGYTDYFFFTF